MKTKIVYILTSCENDYFLEQLILSLFSLRLYNPHTHVVLITDQETAKTLKGDRSSIFEYLDEHIIIEIPKEFNQIQRSRFIKTSMRQNVKGDFLYIDSDTIICDDLSSIDKIEDDIAGVADMHYSQIIDHPCTMFDEWFSVLNLKLPENYSYTNGGFLYVKDNDVCHTFFEKWHTYWKESVKKGLVLDQPALAKTNLEMGRIIHDLDGIWNCQIPGNCLPYFSDAKIIHYFGSKSPEDADNSKLVFSSLKFWKEFKAMGILDKEVMKKITLNAKRSFSPQTAIYGGSDIRIINSNIYEFICKLYYNHRGLYNKLNKLLPRFISILSYRPSFLVKRKK